MTRRYRVGVKDYAAVLWDLDGTIVDTEPMWIAAEHELAAEHGAEWTHEDALQLVGNSLIVSGEYIRTRLGLSLTAEQIVDYLVIRLVTSLQGDVPWRPGAVELITELSDRGMPQALVTMSYAPIAAPIAPSEVSADLPPKEQAAVANAVARYDTLRGKDVRHAS